MKNVFSPVEEYQIKKNTQVKYYLDRETGNYRPYRLLTMDDAVFIPEGWEESKKRKSKIIVDDEGEISEITEKDESLKEDIEARSRNRAINNIRDKLLNNPDCNQFITLTLDAEKINRTTYNDIISKMNNWLDNRVRRKGLKYVIVPELHQDGAIHFHGLCNDTLNKADSGYVKIGKRILKKEGTEGGQTIYNILEWQYGFSTAITICGIDSQAKTTNYIIKYVTKNGHKIGGRYYLSGGKFDKPKTVLYNIPMNEIPGEPFPTFPGHSAKIIRDEETISGLLQYFA